MLLTFKNRLINFNNKFLTFKDSETPITPSLITEGLIVKLDASNYVSGLWVDESGNNNNGNPNGVIWGSEDGGVFSFDGLNDSIRILHNESLSLNTTQEKTIQVWFKTRTLPNLNGQIPVFGKLSSSFGFDGYWGGLFSNDGTVRCVTNGTSRQQILNSTLKIATNTWYLLTFKSIISGQPDTTKLYINTTQYASGSHGIDTYNEANPLELGYIGNGVSSLYLNGFIGAVYFYNKGLTDEEIEINYNATKNKYGL